MTLEEARAYLIARARERGAQLEVFAKRETATSIKAFQGEVSDFSVADRQGLGLRVLHGGAWGYAYTENLGQEALERALDDAIANAELVQPEEHAVLAAWPEPPHVGDLYGEGLSGVGVDRKVQVALELERAALAADPRVRSLPYGGYQDGDEEVAIANTAGLERAYRANFAFQYAAPLVSDGAQTKMKIDWQFTREFEQLDPTRTALVAVEKAVAQLGGEAAATGNFPVVIDRECMATLLGAFAPMFSAKMVQEGKSPLGDRSGQPVGSERVTLVDDATRPAGMASRPFDSEGYPSQRVTLLEGGILRGFLHNSETAARAGIQSTGHAYRPSHKGTVGIAPSNLYIEPGSGSRDDLFGGLEKGVLLTGVQGYHAGANPVTGDFSLQADGFLVQDDKIAHPLEVFTVAGNFLELLAGIEAIADDLRFGLGEGSVGAPSVRVKSLAIAGR